MELDKLRASSHCAKTYPILHSPGVLAGVVVLTEGHTQRAGYMSILPCCKAGDTIAVQLLLTSLIDETAMTCLSFISQYDYPLPEGPFANA